MLFKINKRNLTIEVRDNPLDKLTKTEIVTDNKRRDRTTKSTYWTDDFTEAMDELNKAGFERSKQISREIVALENEKSDLDSTINAQINKAREAVREANNDMFN